MDPTSSSLAGVECGGTGPGSSDRVGSEWLCPRQQSGVDLRAERDRRLPRSVQVRRHDRHRHRREQIQIPISVLFLPPPVSRLPSTRARPTLSSEVVGIRTQAPRLNPSQSVLWRVCEGRCQETQTTASHSTVPGPHFGPNLPPVHDPVPGLVPVFRP